MLSFERGFGESMHVRVAPALETKSDELGEGRVGTNEV